MFRYRNFKLIGLNFSGIPTMWSYTTDDTIAQVTAEGYFDDPRLDVEPVDIIKVQASDGPYEVQLVGGVASVVGGIVYTPEQFGAVGDYDFDTHTGTDNTAAIKRMFDTAAAVGAEIKLPAGKRYLTDTISLTPINNPDYPAKAGRVKVSGPALGIITGSDEPQGSGFAHVNGSSGRLIDIEGAYSLADPSNSAGFIDFSNVLFIGGDQTSDVVYIENSTHQSVIKDCAIRVRNPAGNGLTEITAWLLSVSDLLIRGDADPTNAALDGVWTGIGHKIASNTSDGQINMKTYKTVEIYKCGYGRVIGRGAVTSGTFGPLVFISGQISNCQQHGELVGGGTYSIKSIGVQFEGNRRNGVRIDSDGANDLPRGVVYDSPYITNNGRVEDGSDDSYAFAVIDGVNVRLEDATFQNTGDGIFVSPSDGALNTKVVNPLFRTVTAYGAASGTGFKLNGGNQAHGRFVLENATFNQNFSTNVDDSSTTLGVSESTCGRASFSSGETVVSLLKSETWDSYRWVNFNNSSPTTVTNFTNGKNGQVLRITFDNTNTTIANNANIVLRSGANYTPANSNRMIVLYNESGKWIQAD